MTTNSLANFFQRLFDLFASGRLAVALIAILVSLLFLYLLIPQTGLSGPVTVREWSESWGLAGKGAAAAGFTPSIGGGSAPLGLSHLTPLILLLALGTYLGEIVYRRRPGS